MPSLLTLSHADKRALVRCYLTGKPVTTYTGYNHALWRKVDGKLYPIAAMNPHTNAHLMYALLELLRAKYPTTYHKIPLNYATIEAALGGDL